MPELNQPARVFISYSRKDLSFVERLARHLRAAGLEVWYDLSNLEGGSLWGREIESAIRQSQYFIAVLSPNWIASDWVEEEVAYARNKGLHIIPILYKSCDVPIWFAARHCIDVQGPKYKKNFDQLLKALGVEKPAVPEPAVLSQKPKNEAPQPAKLASHSGLRRWGLLVGMLLSIILLTSGLVWGGRQIYGAVFPAKTPTLPPTKTPTATPAVNSYDGTWVGSTSQGYRMVFTITHNAITSISGTIQTESSDPGCPAGFQSLVDLPMYYPLADGAVSIDFKNDSIALKIDGRLALNASAYGTLYYGTMDPCGRNANVTWTASKQIPTPTSTPMPVGALDPSIHKALTEIKNKAPLYVTGCDQMDSLCDESTDAYGPGKLWDSIGDVAIRDGRIIASSRDIQLNGVSLTTQTYHSFAAEFEFKVEAYGGGCAFMATNSGLKASRFSGFDLFFREDGFMELNRNELQGDSYRVAYSDSAFKFYKYNTITVIVLGEKIAVFINGINAVNNFDSKPTIDYSVFRFGSYDSGECEFDNFKFWDLTGLAY